MPNRPAIPAAVQQQIIVECRHRCAVCCEPTPLERAHIRAWSKSKDHDASNLLVLCANCHQRADNEKWGEAILRAYKVDPCALKTPPVIAASPEQKVLIDLILALNPDEMTDSQRTRFVSMAAAYAGVRVSEVSILSVTPANSIRVRLQMPKDGADRLLAGVRSKDERITAFFEDIPVLRAEPASVNSRTDVSEKGLEALICRELVERGWQEGDPRDYDRGWTVDLVQLCAFVRATQPLLLSALDLENDTPTRQKFLARLQGEISKRGVIDVLRNGLKHGPHDVVLFYATPSPGNLKAAERFALNRFSVTRQLRYSRDETANSLDMALFLTGC